MAPIPIEDHLCLIFCVKNSPKKTGWLSYDPEADALQALVRK